jgi:hypothetical protein
MAYPKLLEVARILLDKSEKGEINWEATADEEIYQAPLSRYSTLIEKSFDAHDSSNFYTLKICNEEGHEIESL